jgi:predicted DNA-binding transcriptional regulator AlpA
MTNPERDQPPQAAGDDVLLSPNEAACRIGMSVSWLAKARARGDGPRFVKYGRSVKYPLSYLLEDMRARTSSSTSPVSSAATK